MLSCQLCKHLLLLTTDACTCALPWSLPGGFVSGTSFLLVGNITLHSACHRQCPVVSPPTLVLMIYSHVCLSLLNNVFKVVDWTITALPTVNPAELCLSSLQGGQCCLPVRPGDRGAGGVWTGAKAGCSGFPCRRPLWLAGRVGCCTQTSQSTYFCNCKFPFTCKVVCFDSFHHRCYPVIRWQRLHMLETSTICPLMGRKDI